ncbi:hypothetical protein EIN_172040 [Entamoeba invadens IP1]|uniref:Ras family protein n=1 Tax=Entamoeba invadens IP1 TaxID=370355 RepID=A0A0A1TVS2_ENTIV|nr:hypothetical protein EIN_172040 [Entamoeba invadens IP1]ELP84599.1 hypothetical protein EIN_172040 [Entamoeba invadens IP1]|eukprot:XP_004183945.1 hypothetical protein EIN_172040 [Entamoeba invadens IP1]
MNDKLPINITICGAPDSGKTAMIRRLLDDEFSEEKGESYQDAKKIDVTVEGFPITAAISERGNDTFMKSMSTDPAARGDVLMYLYNATDRESYENTMNVYQYFSRMNDSAIIYLVASFTDVGKRAVTMSEGKNVVVSQGGFYAEVSSKTGDGIRELFEIAIHNFLTSEIRVDKYKTTHKIKPKKTKKDGKKSPREKDCYIV